MNPMAQSIQNYIKKTGITYRSLGRLTGCPPSNLHGYANGQALLLNNNGLDFLKKLKKELKMDLEELLFGEKKNNIYTTDLIISLHNFIKSEFECGNCNNTVHKGKDYD